MNKLVIVIISLLTFNITSSFSQGIVAGQVGPGMTYYDFPDDTLWATSSSSFQTSDTISLDFNQDGIFDIRFSSYVDYTNNWGSTDDGLISIINQQGAVYSTIHSVNFNGLLHTNGAKPFDLNDTIKGSAINSSEYLWSITGSLNGPSSFFLLWDTIGESYIGFHISVNNQLYFGWIRGEYHLQTRFIIKDMAFQNFSVGVEEKWKPNIQLYPNPVSNYLTIDGLETKNQPIQILDIAGQILLEKEINQNRIDLSQLAAGIYFLKIESNKKVEIKKIIKE